jgi:AcrR family transcriptional regulator
MSSHACPALGSSSPWAAPEMFLTLDLARARRTREDRPTGVPRGTHAAFGAPAELMPADTPSKSRTVPARISRDDRFPPRPDRRARLIAAAERIIDERGAADVTIDTVSAAARLSPSAFDAVFADRTDLLLAVFDEATDRAGSAMIAAYHAGDSWLDGVRAALSALLAFLDRTPGLARFLIVDSLGGELPMRARRGRVLDELARALDADRPASVADSSFAPFGTDAVVSAVAAILHGRLQEDPVPRLRDLGGSLTSVVVLPYLGVSAARAELSPSESPAERDDNSAHAC